MTPEYATPEDVRLVSGGPMPNVAQVNALLEFAYVKVISKVPDLNAKVTAGKLDKMAVKVVLVEMVQAVLRNPGGMRSETTGPFSRAWDVSTASGRLTVTDEQLEMLGGEVSGGAATMYLADHGLPRPRCPGMGWR